MFRDCFSIKMDEFVQQWSGNFEDFLSCNVVAQPSSDVVPPNPAGAHADSETDASLSPVSPPEEPTQASTGAMRRKSPPMPPWKKRPAAVPDGPKMLAKARPGVRPPSVDDHEQQAPAAPAPGQGSSSSSTSASSSTKVIDQALADYQAAEKAINAVAKESLYGPFNECYYNVEKKVAIEKAIGWRDRGPRGPDKPDIWKSQKWREKGQRYANRGGKNRDYFKQKYGQPREESSRSSNAAGQ